VGGGTDERGQTLNALLVEMDASTRRKASSYRGDEFGPMCLIGAAGARAVSSAVTVNLPMCEVARLFSGPAKNVKLASG